MDSPTDIPKYGFQDLKGRRVLVTGASSGIGAAVAIAFGACGAHVGIHFHRGEAAARAVESEITRAGGTAVALQANLQESASRERLAVAAIDRLGGVDVLINNAGGLVGRRSFDSIDDEFINAVFDLNLLAVVGLTHALIPALRASGSGSVINASSAAARNGGGPGSVLYASAKGAINTLTIGLARELGPAGIRVNAVSPGVILTPFQQATTPEALERVRLQVPMGRLGQVADCVGAFLFLASPALAGYVNGAIIDVTGGR